MIISGDVKRSPAVDRDNGRAARRSLRPNQRPFLGAARGHIPARAVTRPASSRRTSPRSFKSASRRGLFPAVQGLTRANSRRGDVPVTANAMVVPRESPAYKARERGHPFGPTSGCPLRRFVGGNSAWDGFPLSGRSRRTAQRLPTTCQARCSGRAGIERPRIVGEHKKKRSAQLRVFVHGHRRPAGLHQPSSAAWSATG